MTIPGFRAEASLCRGHISYRMEEVKAIPISQIFPALDMFGFPDRCDECIAARTSEYGGPFAPGARDAAEIDCRDYCTKLELPRLGTRYCEGPWGTYIC